MSYTSLTNAELFDHIFTLKVALKHISDESLLRPYYRERLKALLAEKSGRGRTNATGITISSRVQILVGGYSGECAAGRLWIAGRRLGDERTG